MKIVSFVLLILWVAVKAAYGINSPEQQTPRIERSEQGCSGREKRADSISALFE